MKGLEKAAADPYTGIRLHGKLEGLWKWRAGKYRVIYMIDKGEGSVVFLDVGCLSSDG